MTRSGSTEIPLRASGNLAAALTLAADGLAAVKRGHALDEALDQARHAVSANMPSQAAEFAAAQDIAYTACRRLNLLDSLVHALLARANPSIDPLLRAAVSELIDHPDRAHMIVDQAVTAAGARKRGAFKGVVNAVLRRFLRERAALLAAAEASEPVRLGYPAWWIARTRAAWPDHWEDVLAAGNGRPPMTLRINLRRVALGDYLARLCEAGIEFRPMGGAAVQLARPRSMSSLPGFAEGQVSVQDFGAQQAAPLLDAGVGMRVLDACAAPGGKTAHLLELAQCDLLALDLDASRLGAVERNLRRLGLTATTRAADAGAPGDWWDGRPFDRILLDAPCTASGVIRRHPDGKWLKREGDIEALAREQARLADAMWHVLRPGGKLLYATCSVFPEENARQTVRFLNQHPDARPLPLQLSADHTDGQFLPNQLHDGFYYALFAKPG